MFPNVGKLGYNYPVTAVDTPTANTITVDGNAAAFLCSSQTYTCNPPCCDDPSCPSVPGCDPSCPPPQTYTCNLTYSTDFAVLYGQYIKDAIDVSTNGSGVYSTVKFFDKKGQGSFAYNENITGADPTPNGVCQVCHNNTQFWKADGTGADHYNNYSEGCNYSKGCTQCHSHTNGFAHGGAPCIECHGHDSGYEYSPGKYCQGKGTFQSHSTHTENNSDDLKGPNITCGDCHNINNYPYFKSGTDTNGDGKYNLSETDVCDPCHSPNGNYNGVNNIVIGAKKNWCQGVYEGNILRTGKENWCLGCHDDVPANISVPAPNVAGDNVNYGYNVTGHGIYGNPSITCLGSQSQFGCHNALIRHTDGNAQTYASASNNYQIGYRLAEGMKIPRNGQYGETAFKLCFKCHDSTPFLTETSSETDFRDDIRSDSYGVRPWNFHWEHLQESYMNRLCWDSDYDWPGGTCSEPPLQCSDSAISCTACHNVHGSPCIVGTSIVPCTDPVNNPMIRHGELISTPSVNRVPAFQFHWYDENDNPVTDFNSSRKGGLRCENPTDISTGAFANYVCWGCHSAGEKQYEREPRINIINESFERSPGYDETGLWTETIGTNCTDCIINEDFSISTLTDTPPPNAGSQCLQSISASPGYEAYATRDYGSEKSSTFTSFYLYVGVDGLPNDSTNKYKKIGALINNAGKDVFALRLNKTAANQLRFNLRLLYNNGSSYYDDYAVINTGNWYRIDIKYDSTNPGSANAWEWWVNGTPKGSGNLTTDLDPPSYYYSGIQRWDFGFSNSGQQRTGTIYYDLIKVYYKPL